MKIWQKEGLESLILHDREDFSQYEDLKKVVANFYEGAESQLAEHDGISTAQAELVEKLLHGDSDLNLSTCNISDFTEAILWLNKRWIEAEGGQFFDGIRDIWDDTVREKGLYY